MCRRACPKFERNGHGEGAPLAILLLFRFAESASELDVTFGTSLAIQRMAAAEPSQLF
jgi:hypothetical protein